MIGERWNKKDSEYLKENYKNLTDEFLGKLLNRTSKSIGHKRNNLGLLRPPKRKIKYSEIGTTIIDVKVKLMKAIINIAETTSSLYILDKCKAELRKLSELE